MINSFNFHGTLYRKLLFHFVLFILLPTILFVMFYTGKINKVLESKVIKNNESTVEISKREIEIIFSNITVKGLNAALSKPVQDLIDMQNRGDTKRYSYVKQIEIINKYLSTQLMTEGHINSIYVYNTKTNEVVVPFGGRIQSSTLDSFHDTSWIEGNQAIKFIKILPMRRPLDEGISRDKFDIDVNVQSEVMTILYPIRDPKNSLSGILVINMFQSIIPKSISADTNLLLNENLEVIYPLELNEELKELHETIINKNKQHLDYRNIDAYLYGSKRYIVNYTDLSFRRLVLVRLSSYKEVFQEVKYYQFMVLALAFVTIAIGVFYALQTVKKIYSPVEATLSLLNINNMERPEKSELKMIFEEVKQTITQNQEIKGMLANQEQNMKQGVILKLLRGNTNINKELLGNIDIHRCLLLSIDNFREYISDTSIKDQFSYKTLILQLAQQAIRKYCESIGIQLEEDKLLFILHYSNDMQQDIDLEIIVKDIKKSLKSIPELTLTYCYGNSYSSLEHIRNSYLESLMALKYRMTYGHDSLIIYDEIEHNQPVGLQKSMEALLEIKKHLKGNDWDGIHMILHDYIIKLKAWRVVSSDNIIEYFYPVINQLSEYLDSRQYPIREQLGFNESLYSMVIKQETLSQVEEKLKDVIKNIVEHEPLVQYRDDHIKDVIEYMDNNFGDRNLDLTMLTDKFNISYSYLRKKIKDQTGKTFIGYINELRINHAKELLAQPRLSVKEIAHKCGYNSEQSFLRNFKKYEGATPTAYRQYMGF